MGESRNPRWIPAYQLFGGDFAADIVLWRRWFGSVLVLVSTTSLWLLFKRGEYNVMSFIVDVLLLLVITLFFWAKSASLFNRPLPPIPNMEIPDASLDKAIDIMRVLINHILSIARDIAVDGNLEVLAQVAISLLIVSFIGNLTDFLTFVYIGVLLSLSFPIFYEKYQGPLDEVLYLLGKIVQVQWRNFNKNVLSKIPMTGHKQKKTY